MKRMVEIRCSDQLAETGFTSFQACLLDTKTAILIHEGSIELLPIRATESQNCYEIDWLELHEYKELNGVTYQDVMNLSFADFLRRYGNVATW